LRDTDVQQPNITSHFETVRSSLAFSAKSGQSDAGSTTTASSCLPRRPPLAFCCSISISMVSFSVVSEIAIVPDSECSTPTLIVSACAKARRGIDIAAAAAALDRSVRLVSFMSIPCFVGPDPAGRGWTSLALAAALAGDRKAGSAAGA
jgi:hypothetical protein